MGLRAAWQAAAWLRLCWRVVGEGGLGQPALVREALHAWCMRVLRCGHGRAGRRRLLCIGVGPLGVLWGPGRHARGRRVSGPTSCPCLVHGRAWHARPLPLLFLLLQPLSLQLLVQGLVGGRHVGRGVGQRCGVRGGLLHAQTGHLAKVAWLVERA